MLIKSYRWYGGKIRMAHKLSFLLPEHEAYYEPFMGSAALLLNHPRSRLEVACDLDPDLVHFMRTLADREKGKALVSRLWNLWYGKSFFDEALEYKRKKYRGLDEIEKAAMVFTLITQSFNGTRKNFANKLYRDTNEYRADVRFHIPKVYERLEGVHILHMDGIGMLERIAGNPNAFAFADPPYRKELRGVGAGHQYECELPHREQVRLLKTIWNARCKIMLCGYKSETGPDLYDAYLISHGWKRYKAADISKSCQFGREHRDVGHEYIWVNYELPYMAKYVINMYE